MALSLPHLHDHFKPNESLEYSTETEEMKLNMSMSEYRRQLSDHMAMVLLPAIILLGILLIVGLVGNSLVLYVYHYKIPATPTRPNILALACFDLITCIVSIPGEILDIRFSYDFMSDSLCKLFRWSTSILLIASGLTLLLVALDRYQRICHPLRNKITVGKAWMRIAGACIVAFLLSVLAPLVYANREIETPIKGITGRECSTDPTYKTVALIYGIALGLVYFTVFTCMIVIYVLIGRRVCRQNKFRATKIKSQPCRTSDGENTSQAKKDDVEANGIVAFVSEDVQNKSEGTPIDDPDINPENRLCRTPSLQRNGSSALRRPSIFKHLRSNSLDAGTRRTTLMLFLITLSFVISFVPHILIAVIQIATKSFHSYDTTTINNILYNIFVRSYFFNTAANPFIYGFCSPQFRHESKRLILSFIFWRRI